MMAGNANEQRVLEQAKRDQITETMQLTGLKWGEMNQDIY